MHGYPLPTEVRACRRHCSRIFAFSPPLGAGIQVYLPAGTGRTPLRLLRIVCRRAPGSFSCMLDILLNTSFLDDMGDHSKSRFAEFCLFFFIFTRMCIFFTLFNSLFGSCIAFMYSMYVCGLIENDELYVKVFPKSV